MLLLVIPLLAAVPVASPGRGRRRLHRLRRLLTQLALGRRPPLMLLHRRLGAAGRASGRPGVRVGGAGGRRRMLAAPG